MLDHVDQQLLKGCKRQIENRLLFLASSTIVRGYRSFNRGCSWLQVVQPRLFVVTGGSTAVIGGPSTVFGGSTTVVRGYWWFNRGYWSFIRGCSWLLVVHSYVVASYYLSCYIFFRYIPRSIIENIK